MWKGSDSTAFQKERVSLTTYLKGKKGEKERLKKEDPELLQHIQEIWELRQRHSTCFTYDAAMTVTASTPSAELVSPRKSIGSQVAHPFRTLQSQHLIHLEMTVAMNVRVFALAITLNQATFSIISRAVKT